MLHLSKQPPLDVVLGTEPFEARTTPSKTCNFNKCGKVSVERSERYFDKSTEKSRKVEPLWRQLLWVQNISVGKMLLSERDFLFLRFLSAAQNSSIGDHSIQLDTGMIEYLDLCDMTTFERQCTGWHLQFNKKICQPCWQQQPSPPQSRAPGSFPPASSAVDRALYWI